MGAGTGSGALETSCGSGWTTGTGSGFFSGLGSTLFFTGLGAAGNGLGGVISGLGGSGAGSGVIRVTITGGLGGVTSVR